MSAPNKRRSVRPGAMPEVLECRQVLTASMIGSVSSSGQWALDINGTPETEIDRSYGLNQDQFVVGNWTKLGDQPGVARNRPDGFLHWYLNTDAAVSPTHEVDFLFGLAGDTAVAGDWDGDGKTNVGVVRRNSRGGLDWYLDLNNNPSPERVQSFGLHGDIPVVGDWDNNGTANVGVVRKTASGFLEWHLDVTGDAWPEVTRIFGLAGDKPVVGDWDGNGRVDVGVTRPAPNGVEMQWLRDTNGDSQPDLPTITFGNVSSKPVVGRWNFAEAKVELISLSPPSAIPDGGRLNLGTWAQGDDVVRLIVVENTGNAPLILSNLTLPAGFTLTNPAPGVIEPGRQGGFSVRMQTSTIGSFSGELSFLTNDGNESPYNFTIAGKVESPTRLPELTGNGNLGEVVQGSGGATLERTFTIRNSGNTSMTYNASLSGTDFQIISGQQGSIARGASTTLVVRIRSTSLGSKSSTLTITTNSLQIPTLQQPLSATIVAPVPVMSLNGSGAFGEVGINSSLHSREQTFTIANPGNAPLTYSSIVSGSLFVIVSGQSGTVAPNGGIATVVVRIQTASTGTKSGTLTINSNAKAIPVARIALSGSVVRGTGKIEVSGSGSFGDLAQNSTTASAEREFVIRNTGKAPLTYNAVLSNSNFVIVSGSKGTVAANGGIARIVVRMTTASAGARNATLTIRSNDTSRPSTAMTLTGRVFADPSESRPEAAVVIGTKILRPGETGQLFYGVSSVAARQATFMIRNTGSGTLRVTNPVISGDFIHDLPASFLIQPGVSRVFKVTMQATSYGTKLGRLMFTTSDSDEGSVRINLLGRHLPPVTKVQGNAASPVGSVYTIHYGGNSTIFIDPSYGNTPMNGTIAISIGVSKEPLSSIVRKILIISDVRPDVENWTGINVQWQSPNGIIGLPRVEDDLRLFETF